MYSKHEKLFACSWKGCLRPEHILADVVKHSHVTILVLSRLRDDLFHIADQNWKLIFVAIIQFVQLPKDMFKKQKNEPANMKTPDSQTPTMKKIWLQVEVRYFVLK